MGRIGRRGGGGGVLRGGAAWGWGGGGALGRVGKAQLDARGGVAATGGWVAGVLFEAWRSAEHVAGVGGEADALHGYLSSQILAQLEPEERELLITTSVLDDVTAERAEALGVDDAGELLASL